MIRDLTSDSPEVVELRNPSVQNIKEQVWNNNGSYQWTYFNEIIKQGIEFFFSRRIHGKNLEVGGGWYLSHPNSTVIDLSPVCLAYNPAKEKIHFDLDSLGEGENLPFEDNSFDSATFVSVWQYLNHPEAVLSEMNRVLRPGAEMYILNGQGAGDQECIVGSTRSKDIASFFDGFGYDTQVEVIPSMGSSDFQSVCVAMPKNDLFGKLSRIENKRSREEMNTVYKENPSLFRSEYAA